MSGKAYNKTQPQMSTDGHRWKRQSGHLRPLRGILPADEDVEQEEEGLREVARRG